jgi:hypothetical protein
MHFLGDPLIVGGEGTDRATADTYAVVFQLGDRESGQSDLTLGMRYLDELAVHDGRWVIVRRSSTVVWMR